MKKSKILMSIGALTLLVAGVLATKANKKFSPYAGPFYTSNGIAYKEVFVNDGCIAAALTGNFASATLNLPTGGQALTLNTKIVYGESGGLIQTVYY